jgi:hypothetical protein
MKRGVKEAKKVSLINETKKLEGKQSGNENYLK